MANGIVLVSCLFLAYINYLFLDYNGCSYSKGYDAVMEVVEHCAGPSLLGFPPTRE